MSFDVATDPVYGTSVFKVVGGQTSCPYEPGSARRDAFVMTVDQPVIEVESGNNAFFTFRIQNNSETDETRSYKLAFNSLTANGAEVSSGGNDFSTDIFIPDVAAGTEEVKIIKVTRPEGFPQYDFEGLEFHLYPACFPVYTFADLVSTVQISAYFPSTCSDIDLDAPNSGWQINSYSPDSFPITIGGYDLDNDFFSIHQFAHLCG